MAPPHGLRRVAHELVDKRLVDADGGQIAYEVAAEAVPAGGRCQRLRRTVYFKWS